MSTLKEYVKKVVPYSYRETDAIEAWLEELAREGLVLERNGCFGLVFRRSEPIRLRFRIDTMKGAGLEQKKSRREQLAEQGWKYVAILGGTVYKHEDLSRWELPEQEEMSPKQKRLSGVYQAASFLLPPLTCIILLLLIFHGKSTLDFVTRDFYDLLLFLMLTLFFLVGVIVALYNMHQVNKRKADHSFWKRSYHTKERARRGSRKALVGIVVSLLIPMSQVFFDNERWEFIPIGKYQSDLPILQLSELVSIENQKRKATGLAELTEGTSLSRNEVVENHNALMLRELMLYQESENSGRQGGVRQGVYYYPFYYELRTENLAKKVMKDLGKEYPYKVLPAVQGVESYYFRAENETVWPAQALLFRYENKVIRVCYGGALDLSLYVPLFAHDLGFEEALADAGFMPQGDERS